MSDLQEAVSRLSSLLTPPTSYTNETKIFAPGPDDPRADFKQSAINMAHTALHVGKSALAGHAVDMTVLSESELEEVETFLQDDPEQHAFLELVDAVQAVVVAINRSIT